MSSQKETSASVGTETISIQNDIGASATPAGNELKDIHVDKKDQAVEYGSNTNPNAVPSLPLSPTPNYYYNNGQGYVDQQTAIAAEAYHAAMTAGYDPSDPAAFAAYGHYGMHPSYSQYYPPEFGYPVSPSLQGQTSPSLAPQPSSPYFTATSPPIAYYPTSPQVGPTGPIHSPPMHPYLYSPQSPYGVLHTLSPTLSHTSSSAPNSPPPQYLPGPGVPSPKVGPLHSNGRNANRNQPQYSYGRRNSGSHQIPPNIPNFNNPTKTTNIYIRGLPPTTTDESLHSMCSIYGSITSSKAIIDQKQGDCKGYGFVMYESEDQAKHAIDQLTRLGLQVSFAKVGYESFSTRLKNLQDLASTNIYLSNLPLEMNEQQLEELFKPYKVISNRILRDTNGTSRGVGFARMEDRESALAIIQKFNGHQLPGASLPLQVRFADSLAQKKLKGQTARKRMWRAREFQSFGGQVPVTPEHMLGLAAPGSPPGPVAYLQYYPEGVQHAGAYPAGSISPPFGPHYVARYYQPIYPGPIIQHGAEGQTVTTAVSTTNPPENLTNDVPLIVTSSANNETVDEISELVQKLDVNGNDEDDNGGEGGDTK